MTSNLTRTLPKAKPVLDSTAADRIRIKVAAAVNAATLAKWPAKDGALRISSRIGPEDILTFSIEDCDLNASVNQRPFFSEMLGTNGKMWYSVIEEMKKLRSDEGERCFEHLHERNFIELETISLLRLTAYP